ncbi:pentapeptide repeat-containing protein [Streptomyces sp. NPDC006332]|uniref:pentapeptide repeat-containing protein n=1 Tax=Streptomyces sp. NPDC006332 TaxID=3155456 RepID=UPI0033B5FABF
MTPLLARTRERRRGLRLWHVWIVLPLAFVAALAVASSVFYAGWDLLGAQTLKAEPRIDSKTLFDLVKLSFGVVAGAGGLVALVVAYRRQRVDEDGALRDATRLHSERFTVAVSQLGDDSAAVRLGGVHALAHLADDAPTRALRQSCIDVLCAYLRLPYTAESDLPAGDTLARHSYLELRQVRHTVIRLIRDHLRLGVEHSHSWRDHSFDFTSVVFDGGDFEDAHFLGHVSFEDAQFTGGHVSFDGAGFTGGTVSFDSAEFTGGHVSFNGAGFTGGTVSFDSAEFTGGLVSFYGAEFTGGEISFDRAEFTGGRVSFVSAQFTGGDVSFNHARSTGGGVSFVSAQFTGGDVSFNHAEFTGGDISFTGTQITAGRVSFTGTQITADHVCFDGAQFTGGHVSFIRTGVTGGTVSFEDAQFTGGDVSFNRAEFTGGTVSFDSAVFTGGDVSFNDAQFTGGAVDFGRAGGTAPEGLPSSGGSVPAGLVLPTAW